MYKYDTEPGITSVEGIINEIKMTEAKLDTNRINFGKVAQDTILRAEFNIDTKGKIGKEKIYSTMTLNTLTKNYKLLVEAEIE